MFIKFMGNLAINILYSFSFKFIQENTAFPNCLIKSFRKPIPE